MLSLLSLFGSCQICVSLGIRGVDNQKRCQKAWFESDGPVMTYLLYLLNNSSLSLYFSLKIAVMRIWRENALNCDEKNCHSAKNLTRLQASMSLIRQLALFNFIYYFNISDFSPTILLKKERKKKFRTEISANLS